MAILSVGENFFGDSKNLVLAYGLTPAGLPIPISVDLNGNISTVGPGNLVINTTPVTTAGDTTIWTPAVGKKFNLMGYILRITGASTQNVAGDLNITYYDDGNLITSINNSFYVPKNATGTLGAYSTGYIPLGQGIVSSAPNNGLIITLSAALVTGKILITTFGTEI